MKPLLSLGQLNINELASECIANQSCQACKSALYVVVKIEQHSLSVCKLEPELEGQLCCNAHILKWGYWECHTRVLFKVKVRD